MTALAQQIKDTPMAPYIGLMQGMSHSQKRVVIAFLVDSMQKTDTVEEEKTRQMLKPNPFKNFRHAKEFSDSERTRIIEKMNNMSISSETNSLIDGLSLTEEEMRDERTRYIIGHDK